MTCPSKWWLFVERRNNTYGRRALDNDRGAEGLALAVFFLLGGVAGWLLHLIMHSQ